MDELPAAEPSGPVVQPTSMGPHDAEPSTASGGERQHDMPAFVNKDDDASANGLPPANDPQAGTAEDDTLLRQFENMTSTATKAAKDYRFLMFEHMKMNMTAALNYVTSLAANSPVTAGTDVEGSEHEASLARQHAEEAVPIDGDVADEYRAKALELMIANLNTTLEYAHRLAHVKAPSELIELATHQARKQFDLVVQTRELGTIAQRLAPHDIASMTSSFAKLFSERND